MKTNDQMPGNDRDYPESDISDNQKQTSNHHRRSQTRSSKNSNNTKGKSPYIKDMPEIVPARTGTI